MEPGSQLRRLMVVKWRVAIVIVALIPAACGGGADVGADPSTTSAGGGVATDTNPDDFRRFEVAGIEVFTRTTLGELPEMASQIALDATIIDSGIGPELCLGNVAESLPPQCSASSSSEMGCGER